MQKIKLNIDLKYIFGQKCLKIKQKCKKVYSLK